MFRAESEPLRSIDRECDTRKSERLFPIKKILEEKKPTIEFDNNNDRRQWPYVCRYCVSVCVPFGFPSPFLYSYVYVCYDCFFVFPVPFCRRYGVFPSPSHFTFHFIHAASNTFRFARAIFPLFIPFSITSEHDGVCTHGMPWTFERRQNGVDRYFIWTQIGCIHDDDDDDDGDEL